MSYTLLGADGRPVQSNVEGRWGGHRRARIYGRLDCPSAQRAIARGGYVRHRVFFADEATRSPRAIVRAPSAAPAATSRGKPPRVQPSVGRVAATSAPSISSRVRLRSRPPA